MPAQNRIASDSDIVRPAASGASASRRTPVTPNPKSPQMATCAATEIAKLALPSSAGCRQRIAYSDPIDATNRQTICSGIVVEASRRM
jgi:hypothetical protein